MFVESSKPFMRSLRIITALVLALLWLPATLHCGLEAAGVIAMTDSCCGHDDSGAAQSGCAADSCHLVEGGEYQSQGIVVKVAAPALQDYAVCLLTIAPVLVPEPEIAVAETVESPREITRTWHFVSRAALPPGAPFLIAA